MAGDKSVSFTVQVKDAATAALKQIEQAAGKATEKFFSFKDVLKDLTAAAAAVSLAEIVKDMVELGIATETTFAKISANLPTATEGIKELKEEIAALAQASGHAVEELEQNAVRIAQLGVSSAQDLQEQLAAAVKLSDATGVSVNDTAALLIQLRREFHLTGDEALATAAKLASATQGKVSVDELFSSFQAASPIFQKFGIDVDTGTRAIVALVQGGIGLRQVRTILNGFGDESAAKIKALAAQATIAADSLQRLNDRAAITENTTQASLTRWKNAWTESLKSVYNGVVTFAVGVGALIEKVHNSLGTLQMGGNYGAGAGPQTTGIGGTGAGSRYAQAYAPSSIGAGPPPKPLVIPISAADQAKLDEAKKKLDDLRLAAQQLGAETEAAKPKSEAFADSIAKWEEKARRAKMPTQEIADQMERFSAVLANMRADEALKRNADEIAAQENAFRGLNDAMSQFTGDTLSKFDTQTADTLDKLDKEAAKFRDDSDATIEYQQRRAALVAQMTEYRAALSQVAGVTRDLKGIEDDLFSHPDDWNKLTQDWDLAIKEAQDLEEAAKNATNPQEAAIYEQALEKVRAKLKEIGVAMEAISGDSDAAKRTKQIEELAAKWAQVARTIIATSQALGVLGDKGAAVAQNLVSLGEGITRIVASGGGDVGGWAEALSSLGGLVKSISGMGHAASEAAQKAHELSTQINGLFLNLTQQITGSGSLEAQIANAKQQYDSARNQIERDLGGKKNQTEREQDLDKLNALEAQRIQQIKDEFAAQQAALQESYKARELRAEGLTAEADAMDFAEKQQEEYTAAVKAGASADTLAALAAAQAAEATQRVAQQQEKVKEQTEDYKVRELRAEGHNQEADALALKEKQEREWAAAVADSGLSADDFAKSAEGVQLAATQAAEATKQFADAMAAAAQAAYDAANATLASDTDVYGYDPTTEATKRASAYGIDLSQFDLSTKAGVDGAIEFLQNDYTLATDPVRKQQDKALIDNLRRISFGGNAVTGGLGSASLSGVSSAVGSGFTSLTTIQGDRLFDVQLRSLDVLQSIDRGIAAIASAVRPSQQAPPQAGSPGSSASQGASSSSIANGGGAGALNVTINQTINNSGQNIDAAIARQINIALTASLIQLAINRGQIDVAAPFSG